MSTIPLNTIRKTKHRGKFAIIDDDDYPLVSQHRWFYRLSRGIEYAITRIDGEEVRMHRYVTSASKGEEVDHRDRNGLNNQKNNLRKGTHQQNMFNRGSFQGNHLKGVYERAQDKWEAFIKVDRKQYHIGTFPTEHLAGVARDMWALDAHGEYADTNFEPLKWLGNQN